MFSRVAAIVLVLIALKALQWAQPLWFIAALVAVGAFESNRYRLSSIARLLSVVTQLGVVVALGMLGWSIAFYAESGRQAPFLRGVVVLLVLGIVLVTLDAVVGAARTLRSSVVEP